MMEGEDVDASARGMTVGQVLWRMRESSYMMREADRDLQRSVPVLGVRSIGNTVAI